jgi:hypothetical protein
MELNNYFELLLEHRKNGRYIDFVSVKAKNDRLINIIIRDITTIKEHILFL